MTITPRMIQSLIARLERARDIVAQGKVYPVLGLPNTYAVLASDGQKAYIVGEHTCTCPDFARLAERGLQACKHLLAVHLYREQQTTTTPNEATTRENPTTPNETTTNGATPVPVRRTRPPRVPNAPEPEPPMPDPLQSLGSLHDPD